jgi:hypothetical protein
MKYIVIVKLESDLPEEDLYDKFKETLGEMKNVTVSRITVAEHEVKMEYESVLLDFNGTIPPD